MAGQDATLDNCWGQDLRNTNANTLLTATPFHKLEGEKLEFCAHLPRTNFHQFRETPEQALKSIDYRIYAG